MDQRPHEAPEWIWYGEVDGKPVVTFGRWPKRGATWRYKWAEIQPTEHDHPRRSDPTARGDMIAEKVRAWYEANRESWWDRHKPGIIGPGPDRDGSHADEFMLRFIGAVHEAERNTPR